jgi:PII-like signaling protein
MAYFNNKYCHGTNKNLTIYLEREENYEGKALYTLQEVLIPQNV